MQRRLSPWGTVCLLLAVNAAPRGLKSTVSIIEELLPGTHLSTGSLYLSRTAGGPISEEEARDILAKEGPIEKLWTSSNTDREMFRLPEGIWVTFAFYQDCRDAQAVSVSASNII